MQMFTLTQTDNHASIPPLSFYRQMPFLPPNHSGGGGGDGGTYSMESWKIAASR